MAKGEFPNMGSIYCWLRKYLSNPKHKQQRDQVCAYVKSQLSYSIYKRHTRNTTYIIKRKSSIISYWSMKQNNYITNWHTNSTTYIKIKQKGDRSPQEELRLTKRNYTGMHPTTDRDTLTYPLRSSPSTTPPSSKGKKKNHHNRDIYHKTRYLIPYTSVGGRHSYK